MKKGSQMELSLRLISGPNFSFIPIVFLGTLLFFKFNEIEKKTIDP